MKKLNELITVSAVVVSALIPRAHAAAQVARSAPVSAWTVSTNYLGIENFQCDCTLSFGSESTPRNFVFRSEPVVLGVMRSGASDGLLRAGDVITHIDGVSILSADGGRRFASVIPGDDVDLMIKRNGKSMKVTVHATRVSGRAYTPVTTYAMGWDEPAVAVIAPTPPASPAAAAVAAVPRSWPGYTPQPPQPALPVQPAHPAPGAPITAIAPGVWAAATPAVAAIAVLPRGWYGFSVRCNGCGWTTVSRNGPPKWESPDIPVVSRVDPESPAGRAGIRRGDRITRVDGLSITSAEGARRFGSAEPGEKVKLTLKRGDRTLEREVTVGMRPETRAAIAVTAPRAPRAPAPPLRRQLRYTGQLDNVSVEVWSPGGPTVDKIGDTMVITVGTSVVRIKVDPKK